MADQHSNRDIRYEPNENPPLPLAIGAGFQAAGIIVAPVALTVVIVARAAQQAESYITWAVFAALVISGLTTALQAKRVGRFGSGHVLIMGTSGAFIAVCVAALERGGPATMASLIVVSSLFQFLMANRLVWLRRVFTPVVSGTVIMLIAATVTPLIFAGAADVPNDSSSYAAPTVALATMAIIVGLVLRASPTWRLWSPVIGIAGGCLVSAAFGIWDFQPVLDAPWVGIPFQSWPGFNFIPDVDFWALLPAFVAVTLVGAIETLGDGVAIQRVSRRDHRATDYRVVQGALNADGLGNLLSGLAGTLPNTTYSTSIALPEVTGIAARRVGVIIGAVFVGLAFLPKFAAVLITIPSPVAASYLLVLVALLFVQGMKIIVQDGIDFRKAMVVGVSFWLGVGFQNQWIFADLLGEGFLGVLLGNGMTSGAIVAIILMLFMEMTTRGRSRLETRLNSDAVPKLESFLREFAASSKRDPSWVDRLILVGEETLANLLSEETESSDESRHLVVMARSAGSGVELEFLCASDAENLEDRLTYLGDSPEIADSDQFSFRLLRHFASSVRHQKYHDIDIITVSVEGPGR